MSQKPSHIDAIRAQYKYTRFQVLWLTGITESQYFQFMYDTGVQWLCSYTKMKEDDIRVILSQSEVWAWWRNEWCRRDIGYLPSLYRTREMAPTQVAARYRMLHQETFVRWTPPFNLLAKHYQTVITEFLNKPLPDENLTGTR